MTHQYVNLRTNIGGAGQYGDEETRQKVELEYAQARAAQTYKYAVAPRQQLKTFDNRTLKAGEEVKLSDFRADVDRAPWKQLEDLVFHGVVLEKD
ncbi:MAG TPA: hypothetical protein VMI54_15810 [Polyangiaceae bacterium]|nr:hypothetical protein [Polyangiaceae bacterium]